MLVSKVTISHNSHYKPSDFDRLETQIVQSKRSIRKVRKGKHLKEYKRAYKRVS